MIYWATLSHPRSVRHDKEDLGHKDIRDKNEVK